MAEFTITLREICASYAGTTGRDPDYRKIIRDSMGKLFDFDFPIYDEAYRPVLETKILKHFFLREIGFDTVGEFKLRLDEKLNLIMPYYNNLYKHASMDFSPLVTTDITTTNTGNRHSDSSTSNSSQATTSTHDETTATSESDGLHKIADTPQSEVTDLLEGKYLTSASSDHGESSSGSSSSGSSTSSGSGTNTSIADSTDSYISHMIGYTGRSAASLIAEYRDTLIGIDKMIINELADLFMGLWF